MSQAIPSHRKVKMNKAKIFKKSLCQSAFWYCKIPLNLVLASSHRGELHEVRYCMWHSMSAGGSPLVYRPMSPLFMKQPGKWFSGPSGLWGVRSGRRGQVLDFWGLAVPLLALLSTNKGSLFCWFHKERAREPCLSRGVLRQPVKQTHRETEIRVTVSFPFLPSPARGWAGEGDVECVLKQGCPHALLAQDTFLLCWASSSLWT